MNQGVNWVGLIGQQMELLTALTADDWVVQLEMLQSRLQDERFNILFVGDFCRGKSTLLNALIGEEILATSAVPITTVNIIEGSDRPFAEVWETEGQQQPLSLSSLAQLQELDYVRVKVGYSLPWLPAQVTLIELPTLEQGTAFTQAIAQADLVIMVVASDSLYSMGEQQAFEQIKAAGHGTPLFVCSCCDRIPAAEQNKVREAAYVRLPVNPKQIFFLSAEQALQGEPQATAKLEAFKKNFLEPVAINGGQSLKQERAKQLLHRSVIAAKTAIAEQQKMRSQTQAAKAAQWRELQLTYEDTAAIGRQLEADLSEFRQRTGEVVQVMTNTFIRNLAQETADWIETTQTTDAPSQAAIEKHIQSTIRRWQQTDLDPYLRNQASYQVKDLEGQNQVFHRQLQMLYDKLGVTESVTMLTLSLGNVSLDELRMEMKTFALGLDQDASTDLLNPSRIALSVAVMGTVLLVVRPLFLAIPASLAGLGATTFFSTTRARSQQASQRYQLARTYEQAIRQQADPISLQILGAINTQFDELQNTVRSHLKTCLKPIQHHLQTRAKSAMPSPETQTITYQQRLQDIEQIIE